MKKMKVCVQFIFLVSSLLLQACTSSMLRIESVPDKADVSVTVLGGGKKQSLGMTPLTQTEIPSELKGVPVVIEISHKGYLTETIIVPDLSGVNIDLRKNLTSIESSTAQDKAARIERLNKAIDLIFDAVKKAQMNNKDEALKVLAEVKKSQPDLAAIYEVEGNIYMMNSDYKNAFASYTEALKYNPEQINLIQMKTRLGKALGVKDLPAESSSSVGTVTNGTTQNQANVKTDGDGQ